MEIAVYVGVPFVIGVVLLVIAVKADRRALAKLREPHRRVPGDPGRAPDYVVAHDLEAGPRRLPPSPETEPDGECVRFATLATSPLFATHADPSCTILHDVDVLIADSIGSMRELYGPLAHRERPLVIIAGHIDPEVSDALVANRLHATPLLALEADASERTRIGALVESAPALRCDLQAGWAPTLGRAMTWRSDANGSSVWR